MVQILSTGSADLVTDAKRALFPYQVIDRFIAGDDITDGSLVILDVSQSLLEKKLKTVLLCPAGSSGEVGKTCFIGVAHRTRATGLEINVVTEGVAYTRVAAGVTAGMELITPSFGQSTGVAQPFSFDPAGTDLLVTTPFGTALTDRDGDGRSYVLLNKTSNIALRVT